MATRPEPETRSIAPRSSLPALLAARPALPAFRIENGPALQPDQPKAEAARHERDGRPIQEGRSDEHAVDQPVDSARHGSDNDSARRGNDDGIRAARVRPDPPQALAATSTLERHEARRDETTLDHRSVDKKVRAQKSGPRHGHRTAGRWQLAGLPLGAVSRLPDVPDALPADTLPAGTPAFQQALAASRSARPTGAQADARALGRWSRLLRRAAATAPDPRLRRELRSLAHYAQELAKTPSAKRDDLAARRPQVVAEARVLRAELPQRFGVDLLG